MSMVRYRTVPVDSSNTLSNIRCTYVSVRITKESNSLYVCTTLIMEATNSRASFKTLIKEQKQNITGTNVRAGTCTSKTPKRENNLNEI